MKGASVIIRSEERKQHEAYVLRSFGVRGKGTRERDFEVSLDICIDSENGVVIGTGGRAQKYAAQIIIPARRYDVIEDGVDENGEPREVPIPIEFDVSLCTIILWEV